MGKGRISPALAAHLNAARAAQGTDRQLPGLRRVALEPPPAPQRPAPDPVDLPGGDRAADATLGPPHP